MTLISCFPLEYENYESYFYAVLFKTSSLSYIFLLPNVTLA